MPKTRDTLLSNKDLGRRLSLLRRRKHKTLTEVAKAANVSVPYLCQLEHGRSSPSSGVIRDLANSLGVPINYLLGEEQKLSYDPYSNPTLRRWLEILNNEELPTEVRDTMEQVLNSLADICTQYSTDLKISEMALQIKGGPLAEKITTYPEKGAIA